MAEDRRKIGENIQKFNFPPMVSDGQILLLSSFEKIFFFFNVRLVTWVGERRVGRK